MSGTFRCFRGWLLLLLHESRDDIDVGTIAHRVAITLFCSALTQSGMAESFEEKLRKPKLLTADDIAYSQSNYINGKPSEITTENIKRALIAMLQRGKARDRHTSAGYKILTPDGRWLGARGIDSVDSVKCTIDSPTEGWCRYIVTSFTNIDQRMYSAHYQLTELMSRLGGSASIRSSIYNRFTFGNSGWSAHLTGPQIQRILYGPPRYKEESKGPTPEECLALDTWGGLAGCQ